MNAITLIVQTVTQRLALVVGINAAALLFVLFGHGTLDGLSPNTDHPTVGFDFFGLPRCGLALRFGTNPFTAAQDYGQYGPWATPWVSQPTLCLAGVPLSYLSPWTAFLLFNWWHLLLHVGIILVFGLRLYERNSAARSRRDTIRDVSFFAAIGLFFPWYVMYYMGQYHSFAVLALALALANPTWPVAGFVLSALSKPVLAPVALVLLVRRRWRAIAVISLLVALGYLPWMFLRYDVASGISVGRNESFNFFIETSQSLTRDPVSRWNNQISLAAALDEWKVGKPNLYVRYGLAAFSIAVGGLLFWRKRYEVAVSACALWFFFLYARGFEYHITLYVPILVCLYTLAGGKYRNWPFVAITILLATPTMYGLFKVLYGFSSVADLTNVAMLAENRLLYYAFLWHKPAGAFLLLGLMLMKEWPYFSLTWVRRFAARSKARDTESLSISDLN